MIITNEKNHRATRKDQPALETAVVDQPIAKTQYDKLQKLLSEASLFTSFIADKLKNWHSTAEKQEILHIRKAFRASDGRRKAPGSNPMVSTSFEQPKLFVGGRLREYQLEGVEWLVSLFENGLNGILADEMGLGKTIQCIAFLSFLYEQGVNGPFLIVAPLSTISNWISEIERFAPDLHAILYHGSPDERSGLRRNNLSRTESDRFPIIVTSYEVAIRDHRYLRQISWKYLIVDEGHRLKNFNCRLVRELKGLKTENRLLLTGTPLHNNLAELWSLLNFILPQIFNDLQFFEDIFGVDLDTSKDNLHLGGWHEEKCTAILSKIHSVLRPFLLRRLKSDVERELPKKREYILSASLSSIQRDYYQKVLDGKTRDLVVAPSRPKPICNDDQELLSDDEPWTSRASVQDQGLQNKFMQLRKVCNHPYLFSHPVDCEDAGLMRVDEEIVNASGKMQLLDQLLKELLVRGHKILVFSQMSRMLDILSVYVEWRGWQYCRIDGSVPHAERVEEIDRFRKDSNIRLFLLSTRAGGLGLNLVIADTVVFFDSDWNPQMDLQAQDRVHRIGQTRPVLIFRLCTSNTVEHRMLQLAAKKFKGNVQLFGEDHRLQVGDLTDILEEKDRSWVLSKTSDTLLTKIELNMILDRSNESYESPNAPPTRHPMIELI